MRIPSTKVPDIFVRWLEDETFFSLCCRQHTFLSSLSSSNTLEVIYENKARPIKPDLPGNLDALNPKASTFWGEPMSIIYEHTILPIFCSFKSEEQIQAAIDSMKGPQIGTLKFKLGLLTGRFSAEHPLKACQYCMEADRNNHGVAYWHLSHQYPGVILCPVHSERLGISPINRQFSGRFRWGLPDEEELNYLPAPECNLTKKSLMNFGKVVLDLANVGKVRRFSSEIVSFAYLRALDRFGVTRSQRKCAATSFAAYCSRIQPFPPLTGLPTTQDRALAFLAQMTRKPRGHCHPLKHVAVINWLFDNLEAFIETYDRLYAEHAKCSLSTLIEDDKSSDTLCLRPSTEGANNAVKRKPKKIKPHIRASILERLSAGDSKPDVCAAFDISICTLNRILRSEPAIQEIRNGRLWYNKLLEHRNAWINQIKIRPHANPNLIRESNYNLYSWLYRYDREWIFSQTSLMPSGRLGNNSHIDRRNRDIDLSKALKTRIEEISQIGAVLNKYALIDFVPGLSRAFEKPKLFPKTRNILDITLNRPHTQS